jgi:RNA ligase
MKQYNNIPRDLLHVTVNDEGLHLVKYSRLAQYRYAWGKFSQLKQARGHVVTSDGQYVARPFDKFFNYQEEECAIDWEKPYQLYEKLDGFLLITYYYDGRWRVTSSGSFDSIYSRWGESVIITPAFEVAADKAKTYCFEGLHSDDRIVIKYTGKNRVVLLGARENKSGQHFLPEATEVAELFEIPTNYGSIARSELLELDVEGREGFIVYQDHRPVGKIKFDNYVRLHSYITNVSHRAIHAAWSENRITEYLEEIPDEAYQFVHN